MGNNQTICPPKLQMGAVTGKENYRMAKLFAVCERHRCRIQSMQGRGNEAMNGSSYHTFEKTRKSQPHLGVSAISYERYHSKCADGRWEKRALVFFPRVGPYLP